MTETTDTERTWHYAGRRLTHDKKLCYYWLDHNGNFSLWKKLRGVQVGAPHTVFEVGEGSVRSHVRWEKGEQHANAAQWALKDAADFNESQRLAAERKATKEGKEQIGNLTIREVRSMLDNNRGNRAGMVAAVIKELGL
jgi:hypothetical protein